MDYQTRARKSQPLLKAGEVVFYRKSESEPYLAYVCDQDQPSHKSKTIYIKKIDVFAEDMDQLANYVLGLVAARQPIPTWWTTSAGRVWVYVSGLITLSQYIDARAKQGWPDSQESRSGQV